MSKNEDYEQLYYDTKYENSHLKKENEALKEQIYLLKTINKNNKMNAYLLNKIFKYLKRKEEKHE